MVTYLKYLNYILEHKKNVFKVAWKNKMYLHAFTHDLSKFSPKEFFPYANWFHGDYGVNLGKCPVESHLHYKDYLLNKSKFEKAWQHHKDKNKHHWNYWHERNLQMPLKYIKQMVVDWTAMGIKFRDTPQKFYFLNYDNIKLDYNSRMALEFELGINDSIINNYGHTLKELYAENQDWFMKYDNFGWIEDMYEIRFKNIFE